jgi:hypothetical protein
MTRKKRHKWVQEEQQLRAAAAAAAATDDEGLQETSELEMRKKRGREVDGGMGSDNKPKTPNNKLQHSATPLTTLNPKPLNPLN